MALAALAVVVGSQAQAFERSTVQGDPSTPLFWRYRHVQVRTAYESSRELSPDTVRLALHRAIATWNAAAEPCSDFRLEDLGPPSDLSSNLLGGRHDGENRIVFRYEDWPADVPSGTLALTTIVYRRSTGQILDADIDLNARDYTWTDSDEPELADTDAQNTLTHELGHLLGLGHVSDPEATMYAHSGPGDLEKRSLSEDDVAGLCFVYPAGLASPGAPHLRGTPLSSGCGVAPGSAPLAVAPIALVIACALRRRRAAG